LETAEAVRAAGLPEPVIVANQVIPSPFPAGARASALRLEAAEVVRMLKEVEIEVEQGAAEELLRTAHAIDERVHAERRYLARLREAGPVVELPFLFTPSFGPPEIDMLADHLSGSGE